jgi:uncharacterized protein (TIGR00369 family)
MADLKSNLDLGALMPFAAKCGVTFSGATPAEVHGELEWAPDRCTSGGVMHGGALMVLADTVGAACAFLNLPPGSSTTTIESKTNFFRAVRSGRAVATAVPLHVGRTIRDDAGKRVALVTQTQAVLASGT